MKLLYFAIFGLIVPLAWGWGFLLPMQRLQSKDKIVELEEIPSQTGPQDQLPSDGEDPAQLEEIQYAAALASIKNIAEWIKLVNLFDEVNEKFNSHLVVNRIQKPLGFYVK